LPKRQMRRAALSGGEELKRGSTKHGGRKRRTGLGIRDTAERTPRSGRLRRIKRQRAGKNAKEATQIGEQKRGIAGERDVWPKDARGHFRQP